MRLPDLLDFCRRINSRKADIVRTLASDSKRSFWAMADQGVVSLGNFSVNILLGIYFERIRNLSDFGSFWILMELILFLNGAQSALVVYPMTVRGATTDRIGAGRMASMSLSMTLMSWPIFAACLLAAAAIAGIGIKVGIWAAVAMAFWQIQETFRRALMSQFRFRAALVGDSISYVGQAVLVAILAVSGALSLVGTFQAMALTSALAAGIQAIQVGTHRFAHAELRKYARESWSLGQWVLFSNLSNLITGPMMSWNFVYWTSKELLGVNYALMNLLRLVNPISFATAMLILPSAARARRQGGMRSARRMLHRFGLLGALMLAPYLGALFLAPALCIEFAYRSGASDLLPYTQVLRLAAISGGLMYITIATGEFLNAVERSRQAFIAQIVAAGVVLLIAMPLTARYDLFGAVIGGTLAAAVHAIMHIAYIRRLPADEPVTHGAVTSIAAAA